MYTFGQEPLWDISEPASEKKGVIDFEHIVKVSGPWPAGTMPIFPAWLTARA